MVWFRVDDHLHSHSKSIRAGTEAMGLWILAGSWSAAEESDGWVPGYMLPRLAGVGAEALATKLVESGLWEDDWDGTEHGYRFHQWEEHQPTRAQLDARREQGRERMRRARAQGGDVRTHSEGTADAVTPTRPDPSRPSKDTTAKAVDSEEFEAFWASYPNKTGKDAARRAFASALKRTDAATIMAGLAETVRLWTAERREKRYTPHPSTWLNAGRWMDDLGQLPDMPSTGPARPSITGNQCSDPLCIERHEWNDGPNRFLCVGNA